MQRQAEQNGDKLLLFDQEFPSAIDVNLSGGKDKVLRIGLGLNDHDKRFYLLDNLSDEQLRQYAIVRGYGIQVLAYTDKKSVDLYFPQYKTLQDFRAQERKDSLPRDPAKHMQFKMQ